MIDNDVSRVVGAFCRQFFIRVLKTAARDGLQAGAAQCAFVKNRPRAASRSIFGVLACRCPSRQPIQSFKSSMAMNRTLGGCAE